MLTRAIVLAKLQTTVQSIDFVLNYYASLNLQCAKIIGTIMY